MEGSTFKNIRLFLCPPSLAKIFAIGLVIRLAIAPWTSDPYDIYPFYAASVDMLAGMGMYGHAIFSYPPGFGMIMYPFMVLLSCFIDPALFGSFHSEILEIREIGANTDLIYPFITAPAFNLALKLPIIIGDLLVASMLYIMVREWKGDKLAKQAYMLWIFNPLTIWIGSVMGQFDVLAVLCTLIAVYFFIHHRNILTGLFLGIGVLIKVYPIYFGILFIIYLLANSSSAWKERFISVINLISGALVSTILVLPLLFTTPQMIDIIFRRAGNDTFGGINVWFPSSYIMNLTSSLENNISIENFFQTPLFIMLIGLALVIVVSFILARSDNLPREKILFASVIVMVIALMFRSITNPQHLLWVLPFILLSSFVDKRMRTPMYALTASGLLFSMALRSPAVVLYPLAAHTPLLTISQLNNIIIAYFSAGSLLPATLLALSSLVGVVAMIQAVLIISPFPSGKLRKKLWGTGR